MLNLAMRVEDPPQTCKKACARGSPGMACSVSECQHLSNVNLQSAAGSHAHDAELQSFG